MPDLRSAFARFDRDGSLALEPSEFRGAVKSLGCDLTALEVSRVFAVVDADHSGFVTYDEFEVKSRRAVRLFDLSGASVARILRSSPSNCSAGPNPPAFRPIPTPFPTRQRS
jgi:hypothetical protein